MPAVAECQSRAGTVLEDQKVSSCAPELILCKFVGPVHNEQRNPADPMSVMCV